MSKNIETCSYCNDDYCENCVTTNACNECGDNACDTCIDAMEECEECNDRFCKDCIAQHKDECIEDEDEEDDE